MVTWWDKGAKKQPPLFESAVWILLFILASPDAKLTQHEG